MVLRLKLLSFSFMTQAAIDKSIPNKLGLRKPALAVNGTRSLSKSNLLHNNICPNIEVDPDTFQVKVDGELAICEPVDRVPSWKIIYVSLIFVDNSLYSDRYRDSIIDASNGESLL